MATTRTKENPMFIERCVNPLVKICHFLMSSLKRERHITTLKQSVKNVALTLIFSTALTTPLQLTAATLSFDNGPATEVDFPNTLAFSSFSGWHFYDDFSFDQDVIINSIEFSVFGPAGLTSVLPQFRISDELLPTGVTAPTASIATITPLDVSVEENGKSISHTGNQTYVGYDITMSNLDLALGAGDHVLSLAQRRGGSSLVMGYGSGGADTVETGLTCFRQRSGLGTLFDRCLGGTRAMAFSINAVPVLSQVPLPATGLLLAGAFASILAMGRKRSVS